MLPYSILNHDFKKVHHTEHKTDITSEQASADKTDDVFAQSFPKLTAIGTEYAKSYLSKFADEGSQYVTEEIAKNVFTETTSEGTTTNVSSTTSTEVKEPKTGLRLAKKAVSGTVGGVIGETLSPSTTKAEQRKLIAAELSQNIDTQHAEMQNYIEAQMKKQPERVERLNQLINQIKTRYSEEQTAGNQTIRQSKQEGNGMAEIIVNAIVETIIARRQKAYEDWASKVDTEKTSVAEKTQEQLDIKKEKLKSDLDKRTSGAKSYIEEAKKDEDSPQPSRLEKIGIKGGMVASLGVAEETGAILIQRVTERFIPAGGLAGAAAVGTAVIATTIASAAETEFTPFTNPLKAANQEGIGFEEDKKLALATRVANNVLPLVILTALSPLELTFFATLGVGIVASAAVSYLNPVDQSDSEVKNIVQHSLAKGYTKEMFDKFSQADEFIWNRIINQIALASIESIEDINIKETLLKEFSYLKDLSPEAKTEEQKEDDKVMAQLLYTACGIVVAIMIAYQNHERKKSASSPMPKQDVTSATTEKPEAFPTQMINDPVASKVLTDMAEKQVTSHQTEASHKLTKTDAKKIATQSVKQAVGFLKAAILEQCNTKVRSLALETPKLDSKTPEALKAALNQIGERQKQIRAIKAEYLTKYPMLKSEIAQICDWGLKKLGGDKAIVISLYKMGHLDSEVLLNTHITERVSKKESAYKKFQQMEEMRKDIASKSKELEKSMELVQTHTRKQRKKTAEVSGEKLRKVKIPVVSTRTRATKEIKKTGRRTTKFRKIGFGKYKV